MSLSYRVKCVSYRNYIHLPSDCIREMLQFWHCTLDCDPSLVSLISRQVPSQLTPSPVHLDVWWSPRWSWYELSEDWGLLLWEGADGRLLSLTFRYCIERGEESYCQASHQDTPCPVCEECQHRASHGHTGTEQCVLTSDGDIHSLLIFCIARSLLNHLQSPSIFYVI